MKEKEEAEEAKDLPTSPPNFAYRICYKIAKYRWISDFKMSMEVS